MPLSYLRYPLDGGFINDWLVAGPVAAPIAGADAAEPLSDLFQRLHQPGPGFTAEPVDTSPVNADEPGDLIVPEAFTPGAAQGRQWSGTPVAWHYQRSRADHFVDLSAFHPVLAHLRAWAYAELETTAPQTVTFLLTTDGPADLWLNDQHLHRQVGAARRAGISATLEPGVSRLLVRFEQIGRRDTPYALALQVHGLAESSAEVRLPTDIDPEWQPRRPKFEELVGAAYLDRYVFGYPDGDRLNKNEPIAVSFAEGVKPHLDLTLRAQSLRGDIFQEVTKDCTGGTTVEIAKAFPLRNGPHHLAVLPVAKEYYERRLRFDHKDLFYVVRTPYTVKAGATLAQRAQEALADAAERRGDSLYTEIAKMALDKWDKVRMPILLRALEGIQQRRAGSVFDLLGLLALRLRYRRKRLQLPDIRGALEAAARGFLYAPGDGPNSADAMDTASESAQLAFHACEILAGRLFPQKTFAHTGQTGEWHRARGLASAIAWMQQRGRFGFQEWNSPESIEAIVAALTCLVDQADSDPVSELASVLLDKLFFTLAVNSFRGAFGVPQGRAALASVLSARLQATSGLSRLLWGQGNFTEAVLGQVSLALCRRYELPDVIRQVALSPVDAVWSQERHQWPGGEVNLALYKTKNYLLACAQDYRPGQPGAAEHIWQATLGPDAVVFTNHPANLSETDARRPNLWVGNGLLPRAVQWGDVLMAAYQLPADDWLGYTHAYFPARAFDEHVLEGGWAFARQGDAYLALTAQRGLDFQTTGQTAWRELRSTGLENVWVCHLGQALLDGSFAEFRQKVLALTLAWEAGGVRFTSLRGDRLALGWQGPLLVNDQPQNLVGPNHIENPYGVAPLPANQFDIVHQGQGLRLKFE